MKFLLNLVAAGILAFGLVTAQADTASGTGTNNAGRVTSVFTNGAYITSINIANANGAATVVTLFDTPFAPGVISSSANGPAWTNSVSFTNFTPTAIARRTEYTDVLGNTATNVITVVTNIPTVLALGSTNNYRSLGVFSVPAATTTTLDLSANPLLVVFGLSFTNLSGSNSVSASFFR